MRRAALLLAFAMLTLAPLSPAPSLAHGARRHRPPGPRCPPAHAQLLAADAQAQIYAVRESPEYTKVLGCATGHASADELGFAAACRTDRYMNVFCSGIDREVLAGPIVAYELVSGASGCGFCHWSVIVRDMRSGRMLRDEATGTPTNPAFRENLGVGPTTAIVLKSDGALAWIANAGVGEGGYQVHAVDATGAGLLASGRDLDPSSLALAGSTLYWTQAGRPFAASLR
jgi:hypothetical protein